VKPDFKSELSGEAWERCERRTHVDLRDAGHDRGSRVRKFQRYSMSLIPGNGRLIPVTGHVHKVHEAEDVLKHRINFLNV
jgi:hypothetical protein